SMLTLSTLPSVSPNQSWSRLSSIPVSGSAAASTRATVVSTALSVRASSGSAQALLNTGALCCEQTKPAAASVAVGSGAQRPASSASAATGRGFIVLVRRASPQ